jgi:hypothetical protein
VELGHQLKVMAGTLVASPLKGFPFLFIVNHALAGDVCFKAKLLKI